MTTAILEILFLLTVSCLIGVFFTFLYWRSKYRTLHGEYDRVQNELTDSKGRLAELSTKLESLEVQLAEAQKPAAKSVKDKVPAKKNSSTTDKKVINEYKSTISILKEQMDEKEREI